MALKDLLISIHDAAPEGLRQSRDQKKSGLSHHINQSFQVAQHRPEHTQVISNGIVLLN